MNLPTQQDIAAKYYEIEKREGGLAVADLSRVAFLTAVDLDIDPKEVRSAMVDELCKVGAG